MVDQYGGQHFNPNSIPIFRHHFCPALLGSSWSVQRLGSQDVLAHLESCFEAKFQVMGKDPARVIRKLSGARHLEPMSQHQQKSPERPNPSIRMMFSSVAKNLDLGSGLKFVSVMMSYLIWHLWNGQRAKYSGGGWQPSSSDWCTSFPSRLGFCGWLKVGYSEAWRSH